MSSEAVGNAARTSLDAAHRLYSCKPFFSLSSSRRLASRRQIRQSQSFPAIMTMFWRLFDDKRRTCCDPQIWLGESTSAGGRGWPFERARPSIRDRANPTIIVILLGIYYSVNGKGFGRTCGQHKKRPRLSPGPGVCSNVSRKVRLTPRGLPRKHSNGKRRSLVLTPRGRAGARHSRESTTS